MNWLFPGFLAGALAAGIPLALHLLRRWPRHPVVFPSLRFLAAGSRRTESFWQRLRRWLVLALRCAVFGLLAAAFARPFHGANPAGDSRAVVVVVDNSFSLQTKGRWESLRHWARQRVGTLAPGDRLGLLLMGPQPTWLVAPTTETDRPLHALEQLQPGWLTTRAEPALRLAGDTLAALPTARHQIILLGDNQRLSWSGADFSKKLPPGVTVVFPPVPPSVGRQAAILAPTLSRTETGIEASISIHNFTNAQKRTLSVYLDGASSPIRREEIDLPRREVRTLRVNLPAPPDQAAYFRFSLDADDLAADDTAYAVWQPAADGAVLLDPSPPGALADYAATALAAAADLKPPLHLAPIPQERWPARAVAVLRDDASFSGGTEAHLNTFLTAGGSALIFIGGGPAQQAWLAAHGIAISPLPAQDDPWRVHDWAMEHPVVVALTRSRLEPILGWEFNRGWALPADAVDPLAHWSENTAAIGEARVGAGRVLICGFPADRSDGDWPVTAPFVPFLHQTVAYLFRAEQTAIFAGQPGRALELAPEPGKWRPLDGPTAGQPAITASGSIVPMAPGVYEFAQGTDRKMFAINLVPEESDPAAWTDGAPWLGLVSAQPATTMKAPRIKLAAADAEQSNPLWWWAVAAAAVLLLAELGLANRTAR